MERKAGKGGTSKQRKGENRKAGKEARGEDRR